MSVREQITAEQLATYTEYVKPMRKLRKKGGKGILIFYLICVVLGGCIGFFGSMFKDKGLFDFSITPPFSVKEGFSFVYLIAALVWYIVTVVIHTIVHEGGHMVFGLLTGYKFLSFRVFSFTLVKKDGKLIRKKIKVAGTAGQCLMIPPEWKENEPYPYVWYNLGGGIMNLLFCLPVIPLFWLHSPFLSWTVGIYLFSGVLFAFTNMVPMTIGIPNDGKNCLLCKKAKENRKAFYLQLKLNAMMSEGVTVRDIPEELLRSDGETLNPLTYYIDLMKFYQLLQRGEEEAAEAYLTSMEERAGKLPTAFLNTGDLERLYCMLVFGAPLEKIAAYYAVLQPVFAQVKDLAILRVKYAYYLLLSEEEREMVAWFMRSKKNKLPKRLPKQKPMTAEKIYEEMETAYAKHPVIGEAELYMDLAKYCKEKCAAVTE